MNYIRYNHHGDYVTVREDLKGKHRDHCLCYSCLFFHPNQPTNCPIAQALFSANKALHVTTPVWECAKFEELV